MPVYNKLVRDKIPSFIEREGKSYTIRTLKDQEFVSALLDKFGEEVDEFNTTTDSDSAKEELADILEILISLSQELNSDLDEIVSIAEKKREIRGGFDKKLFLIDIED